MTVFGVEVKRNVSHAKPLSVKIAINSFESHTMIVLGLSGALGHDASAAILVDGKIIAAAEEERFIRDKHAKNKFPYEAAKFCLKQAGVKPEQVDIVAFPYAEIPLSSNARWHYAKRHWYAPDRALDALFNGNRRFRRNRDKSLKLMADLGLTNAKFVPVEHHLAHASSAYHLSGFKEKTAIVGIDGKGEYATTFFGYGENGKIHKIKEFYDPDSLGGMYGAITEFLGFEMLDGEFKVMGMAPYGDPNKYDLSRLVSFEDGELKVNTKLVNVVGLRRYKEGGKGYYFTPELIDWLGPKRHGDEIDDPYIHYAASVQQLLEDTALKMIDYYLGDIIKETAVSYTHLDVYKRQFYLCHLALKKAELAQNQVNLILIDLHRMALNQPSSGNAVMKDIAGLVFSTKDCGFTAEDWVLFKQHYLPQSEDFWAKVEARANQLYGKYHSDKFQKRLAGEKSAMH